VLVTAGATLFASSLLSANSQLSHDAGPTPGTPSTTLASLDGLQNSPCPLPTLHPSGQGSVEGGAAATSLPNSGSDTTPPPLPSPCPPCLEHSPVSPCPAVPAATVEPLASTAVDPHHPTPTGPTKRPPDTILHTVDLPSPALVYIDLLTMQFYARGARRYLEWGSGGSTSLVAPLAQRAWSVDNNKEWCAKAADREDVKFVRGWWPPRWA
jgi:hypothetical protein